MKTANQTEAGLALLGGGVLALLVFAFSLSEPANAEGDPLDRGYSAEEWRRVFDEARAANAGSGVTEENVIYHWTGEEPVRFYGRWVERSGGSMPGEGKTQMFQVDPIWYAQLLADSNWKVLGPTPQALEGGSSSIGDCNVVLLELTGGGLDTTCVGSCPAFMTCNGDAASTPTWCGCVAGSGPPTSEPSYCFGKVEQISPGVWEWDCVNDCAGDAECDVKCYTQGGLTRWYCGCS